MPTGSGKSRYKRGTRSCTLRAKSQGKPAKYVMSRYYSFKSKRSMLAASVSAAGLPPATEARRSSFQVLPSQQPSYGGHERRTDVDPNRKMAKAEISRIAFTFSHSSCRIKKAVEAASTLGNHEGRWYAG